ncbi:MAG: hypothetical protein J6S53_11635 [Lentisphaeria bacterium]|nr:hypothetical protein [Lentisphaeria bacterium]
MKFLKNIKSRKAGTLFIIILLLAGTFSTITVLQAQSSRASARNSKIWALWRKGFEDFENAELKMISRKYPEAIAHYTAALESFKEVRKLNPKWNKDVIEYRINRAERRIDVAKDNIRKALPSSARTAITSGSTSSREITAVRQKLNAENAALRKQLDDAKRSLTAARVQASSGEAAARQVKGLLADREKLEKELAFLKLKFDNQEKLRTSTTREHDKLLLQEKARNDSLAKVIQEQNRKMLSLQQELKNVSFDRNALDSRIRELQKAAEEERSLAAIQLKQERNTMASLRKQLEKNEEKVLVTEKALIQSKTDNEKLQGKINALQTSGNASSLAVKQTQTENADLRKKLDEINNELITCKTARNADSARIVSLEREIRKLQQDLAANIRQRNEYGTMNDSFVKRIASLEKEMENLKKENSLLASDKRKLTAERDTFAERINKSLPDSKLLARLQQENIRLTAEEKLLKNRIEALKEDQAKTKKDADASLAKIIALQGTIATLNAAKVAANSRITVLEAQKSALDKRLAFLAVSLQEKDNSKKESDEIVTRMKGEKASLEKKIVSLTAALQEKDAAKSASETKITVLAAEKASLERRIALLTETRQKNDAAKSASDAKITVLTAEKDILEKRLAALTATGKENDSIKKEMENRIRSLVQEKEELNKKLLTLNSLQKDKDASDKKVAALILVLQQKDKELASVNAGHREELERSTAAYKKELQNAVAKQMQAETLLAAALQEKKIAETKLSAGTKENADLVKQNTALTNEVKNMPGLHAQIRKLTLERDMAEKALAVLKDQQKETKNIQAQERALENARLSTKLAQTEKDMKELEEKAKKLAVAEKELLVLKGKSAELDHVLVQLSALKVQAEKLKNTEKQLAELEKQFSTLKEREKALIATHVKKEELLKAQSDLASLRVKAEKLTETEKKLDEAAKRLASLEKETLLLKENEKKSASSLVKKEELLKAEERLALLKKEAERLKLAAKDKETLKAKTLQQEQEISRLKGEIAKLEADKLLALGNEAKIASLEKSIKTLAAEKDRLNRENANLTEMNKQLVSAPAAAALTLQLAKSEELRKTLETEKTKHLARLKKYEEDTVRMMKDMQKLVYFRNTALTERNKLAAELEQLKSSAKNADEKIMETEKKFLAMQQQMDENGKKHAEEMQKTLTSQNESIAALKKVNNEYLVAIGKANIAKEIAEKENIRLKAELEKATKHAIEALKYQEDSKKLLTVQEELSANKKDKTTLLARMKLLQENLEKIGKENLTLQNRSEELGKEYIRIAAERDQLKKTENEYNVLKNLSTAQKDKLASLQKEYELLSAKQSSLEEEHAKAKKELAKWKTSDDPLVLRVREIIKASKGNNVDQNVIDELVHQISTERKKQEEAFASSIVAHNEAVRERNRAELADAAARKALLDAVRVQAEMTVLKKDIEDGYKREPSPRAYAASRHAGQQAVSLADKALAKTLLPLSALRIPVRQSGKNTRVSFKSAALPDDVRTKAKEEKVTEKVAVKEEKAIAEKEEKSVKKQESVKKENKQYTEAMKKGAQAEKEGDYSMALWHYWQAADAGEKEFAPYIALAKLNIKRNEKDAAEKAYQKALQLGAPRDEALEKAFQETGDLPLE